MQNKKAIIENWKQFIDKDRTMQEYYWKLEEKEKANNKDIKKLVNQINERTIYLLKS